MQSLSVLVLVVATACCSSGWALDNEALRTSERTLLQGGVELNRHMIDTGTRHLRNRHDRKKRLGLKQKIPFYHTSDEIHQEAKHLAKNSQGMASVRTLNAGDVAIDVVRVRAQQTVPPTNRAFLLFGEHSRELISPESGLRLLQVICGKVEIGRTHV